MIVKKNEHLEQSLFVSWFRATFPGVVIFAIPNGGHRNKVVAYKLKMEGVLPGVPDLFIPEWRLWVEMKKEKEGKISEEQKIIMEYLRNCGYTAQVCHGFEEAKRFIIGFLDSLQYVAPSPYQSGTRQIIES